MERNMDLCRLILFKIEAEYRSTSLYNLNIDGFDLDTVAYHCKILPDAGFLDSYEPTCCIENKIQIEFCKCLILCYFRLIES